MRSGNRKFSSFYADIFFAFVVVFASIIVASRANAATYFISTTGSDSNSGTSSSPWKTFAKFFVTAVAGDTLILRDGTYTVATSGRFMINCGGGGNARNGSSGAPVTITSENPRKGFILGDGTNIAVAVDNCHYWVFDNLRIENTANNTNVNYETYSFAVGLRGGSSQSNITLKRSIIRFPNNGFANVKIYGSGTSHVLVEDNEILDFTGHGLVCQGGATYCTFRRNYINPRDAVTVTKYTLGGSYQPMICYGCGTGGIWENNIVDVDLSITPSNGYSQPTGWSDYGPNQQMLGNIIITPWSGGFDESHHPQDPCCYGINGIARNNVVLMGPMTGQSGTSKTTGDAFRSYVPQNLLVENMTVIGTSINGAAAYNLSFDTSAGTFGITPKITIRNSLAVGNGSGTGLFVFGPGSFGTLTLDYFNIYNFGTAASGATPTHYTQTNSALGACTVFIPAGSPMKGAGYSGSDIGANILYAYQDGSLQDGSSGTPIVRLWDSSEAGENYGRWLFAGAVIPGVNDGPTNTVQTFHKKIGFGAGGCILPTEYGASSSRPVGSWKFDEGSGTSVSDASANSNTGALLNGPVWTEGTKGTAISFDGMASYVDMGTPLSLNITGTAITVQAWVKSATSPGNYKYIVSKTDGLYVGYGLYTGSSGTIRFYIGNGSGITITPDVASPWDNRWHHVVGTYDGSSLKLYIDGVASASVAATGSIGDSSAQSFNVGRFNQGGFLFKGAVDDVQIYNRALIPTEIQQLYQQGVPAAPPSAPVNLVVTQ